MDSDRIEFLALRQGSRTFLERWEPRLLDGRDAFSPAMFDRLLRFARSPRYRKFLVCLRETGEIVGGVNLNGIAPHPFLSATMGYWVAKRFARQGLTTEAVNLAVGYAFQTLELHRVEANIMPRNAASLALIRRCGFRFEGLAKRYLEINGKWEDHERWAMTVEDWRRRRRLALPVNPRARSARTPRPATRRSARPS